MHLIFKPTKVLVINNGDGVYKLGKSLVENSGAAVRRPHCMHQDVGSNPAADRNDFGQTPAQKVPQ